MRVEVRLPAERIDELATGAVLSRTPRHRVHGEIAARQIFLERIGEGDVVRAAMIRVVSLDAIGRDLDLVVARADDDRSEAVRVQGSGEELLDLLRRGIRRDVPVLWVDAADRVAHAAADDVRIVAGLVELRHDALNVLWSAQLGDGHGLSLAELRLSGYHHGTASSRSIGVP